MQFLKQAPLSILSCLECRGTGYVAYKKCPECDGMIAGRWTRGRFLYWGESVTSYHIALRKARGWLDRFHIIGALLFGFGFLGLFFWDIGKRNVGDQLFTLAFWSGSDGNAQPLFWMAVVSGSYLLYRVIVMFPKNEYVEASSYEQAAQIEDVPRLLTWSQMTRLRKAKRVSISATFTLQAKQVIEQAFVVARRHQATEVTPIHLLYALASADSVLSVFLRLGIPGKTVQSRLASLFSTETREVEPVFSEDLFQILFHAYEYAYEGKQEQVQVTELLWATVNQSEEIQELLYDMEVDRDKLENVIEWMRIRERLRRQHSRFSRAAAGRSKYGIDKAMTAVATPYLNNFSKDLTLIAKYGNIDTCVARDEEIEEVFRIVEGGRQSVVLVGERGVGKRTIIEGIVERMIEDTVPKRLRDKRLVQISTSALLAGTTVAGAQERLIRMMNEIAHAGNVIVFINNIHDLMSIGTGNGDSGMDVSETLAEYLNSGRFLTFATTTVDAYNRFILRSELGKTLARVEVKEMDQNQAIQALEAKVGYEEYKHNVFFSYDSLAACVRLSGKFLHDQVLPQSAFAVMSETASLVRSTRGEHQLVDRDDVAAIISQKTGIPVTTMTEDESEKLLRLEEEMHKRVVGQDEAVYVIANALRRARAEIRSQNRPIANFLFLGPTGVGKTELAKTIAEIYFGGEDRMIRLDMSEYQDTASVYRLIGQPGQQGTGILTEAVRQRPFSLVLLDEMEKADPNILNIFLQVFDDGRLTDSTGRVIDFTNTIIIATSNAGTTVVTEQVKAGVPLEEIKEQLIRGELKQYYRPEFLNRFDSIVLFKSLNREEIKQIAGLMLKRIEKELEDRGYFLRVENGALEVLADIGFDPEFGARPMRRAIQDRVENTLAELLISKYLKRRDTIILGDGLRLWIENPEGNVPVKTR